MLIDTEILRPLIPELYALVNWSKYQYFDTSVISGMYIVSQNTVENNQKFEILSKSYPVRVNIFFFLGNM